MAQKAGLMGSKDRYVNQPLFRWQNVINETIFLFQILGREKCQAMGEIQFILGRKNDRCPVERVTKEKEEEFV